MDKIVISDLLLRCIIGINDFERKNRQDVLVHIVLYTDIQRAAESDNICETVNYKDLTKKIINFVENSSYYLIEALVDRIAKICLKFDHVNGCRVQVDKPGALRFVRKVGIEIERWNDGKGSGRSGVEHRPG